MPEEILPGLYRIEVPLPNSPLKILNFYAIKDPERNKIIDTGMNREECLKAMLAGLREINVEINVDLQKTGFFITHLHADHLGLVSRLAATASTVYFNQPDADFLNFPGRWEEVRNFALQMAFLQANCGKPWKNTPVISPEPRVNGSSGS